MGDYENRAKIIYKKYDEIQQDIDKGIIDIYDIVYTKDTHENLIIAPDYSIVPIKSKVYCFIDIASAETFLNSSSDTYEGEIVSIITKGNYSAYIVNKQKDGNFFVTSLNGYSEEIDYNSLGNRPINTLDGTIDNPINVASLDTGQYLIRGQYKLGETIYVGKSNNIFLIEHVTDNIYIKKISANNIINYSINKNGIVTSSVVPTMEWLSNQGYVTEQYIDIKIAALNAIIKKEIEEHVLDVVLRDIDLAVETRINQVINERFPTVTEQEALEAFKDIFLKQ